MASGIAHDINNALTPAVIYVSMLLRDSDLSPAAQRQLQAVYTACNDVVQTVSRMREFYRKRADDDTLYSIDLNKIVLQVLDLTRPRWKDMLHESGRVIDLQTELKEDLLPILGVESEIREALTHLIFNAVDAMHDGEY
jgi:signal transduction histidine kinase